MKPKINVHTPPPDLAMISIITEEVITARISIRPSVLKFSFFLKRLFGTTCRPWSRNNTDTDCVRTSNFGSLKSHAVKGASPKEMATRSAATNALNKKRHGSAYIGQAQHGQEPNHR